jgi:predicted ATPase
MPCGAALASVPPVDPIALAFWLELFGRPDPALAPSELEPQARRARLFQSLGDLILARARASPCCSGSRTCTFSTRRATRRWRCSSAGSWLRNRRQPGLLIATTRPDTGPPGPAGSSISPFRLSPPGRLDLARRLAGPDPALAPLRARIEARAQGNPLFVEEIVRSLVERGALRGERGAYAPAAQVEEIALPETVQAVLASRIDRLAPRDKDVLQAAAVVGHDVPTELLRAVVDLPGAELAASLERLVTAELLAPGGLPGEHAFRHPLTHEVAYRTQLLDRRRGTHAAVARALLAIHGSAAPAHAALLAHHFEEAREHLEAARWHERAGRRVARSDPAQGARIAARSRRFSPLFRSPARP